MDVLSIRDFFVNLLDDYLICLSISLLALKILMSFFQDQFYCYVHFHQPLLQFYENIN